MSDQTDYTTANPTATSESTLIDGSKFNVWTIPDSYTKSIFNYDGSLFGTWDQDGGIFSGSNAEDDKSFINNESIWRRQSWFESNTTKDNKEKSQKDSGTKFTVVGVEEPRQGTLWSEKAFSSKSRTLVYPEDHAPEQYDFIKITPIEYVPALGADDFKKKNTTITTSTINANTGTTTYSTSLNKNVDVSSGEWFGFESLKSRYMRVKRVGSTMFLPMVPDIQESNAVGWGEDTMNPLQAAAGRVAFDTIGIGGAGRPMDAVRNLIGQGGEVAQAFINTGGMGDFIKAYFAGRAVNANLLGRAGIAINPNLEVLFDGPLLRTFNYNFRFTPRTDSEAETVRTIIKVFKKTMAPKRRGKVFLSVPAVYKIKYVYNSQRDDHPFLNKIKPCALSGFNVQYAPDGSYMTYEDGSMTSYNVSMTFKELEPIYNDDIRDVDRSTTGF